MSVKGYHELFHHTNKENYKGFYPFINANFYETTRYSITLARKFEKNTQYSFIYL